MRVCFSILFHGETRQCVVMRGIKTIIRDTTIAKIFENVGQDIGFQDHCTRRAFEWIITSSRSQYERNRFRI